jgi:spore coat polysaccharide biosynthesis protein SpsF (cytidylyltransferase family)
MKIIIGLQARTSSKRLPGKVLKKINRRPLLSFVIDRLKKTKLSDEIFVLTSIKKTDDKIEEYCKKNKIKFFRGSLDNVLSRFVLFGKKFNAFGVVRICADSPLIDYNLVNKMSDVFREKKYDIITNTFPRTFPSGQSIEIIRTSILSKIDKLELNQYHKEHVTSYIYKNHKDFKIKNFSCSSDYSKFHLSIDVNDDFERFKSLVKKFKGKVVDLSLKKIIESY